MTWVAVFFILAGGLFALKMTYVLCTALVLPYTRGALYVSTSRRRIAAVLDVVPMQVDQVLVDLGCGDGRVLRQARRRFGVHAVGYELNPLAYWKARLLCAGYKGIKLLRLNFLKADLSDADLVFCYLFPDVMRDVAAKLKAELKAGATVASCNFALPGFTPDRILRPPGALHHDPIYIYRMPAFTARNG
jgi:SAM-dependent methyltransferase